MITVGFEDMSYGMLRRIVWKKLTDVSGVFTASIIKAVMKIVLMMEAVSTSETSVSFYKTAWCYIPGDSHLHTPRCENLQSHAGGLVFETRRLALYAAAIGHLECGYLMPCATFLFETCNYTVK
jgi:hypothetical protein